METGARRFSERYGFLRTPAAHERSRADALPESFFQSVWSDQLFASSDLLTDEDCPVQVLSPGWWNHAEGPDFRKAQIAFAGRVKTGDVEIHLTHADWKRHGHNLDARYDDVILVVVLEDGAPKEPPRTSMGRRIPTLSLRSHIDPALFEMAEGAFEEGAFPDAEAARGRCAELAGQDGERIAALLDFAGDWRMLEKARAFRARMERVGAAQALYENFLAACGFSRYKHHFRLLAQQFPYDRARQLALQDALLVETAFLQLCGLLPDALPEGTSATPHFARLRSLRRDHLAGLRMLPLSWNRAGVRPTNYPERRLSGAALFISRTAALGLEETFFRLWAEPQTHRVRREAMAALFPKSLGFWSTHCSWAGKKLGRPTAPIGAARIHSIIGNVFVPAALAVARQRKDRAFEERAFDFFEALPGESENRILKDMAPRVFGGASPRRISFRRQQGLLQLFQDWCETNPSCGACRVPMFLERMEKERAAGASGD